MSIFDIKENMMNENMTWDRSGRTGPTGPISEQPAAVQPVHKLGAGHPLAKPPAPLGLPKPFYGPGHLGFNVFLFIYMFA